MRRRSEGGESARTVGLATLAGVAVLTLASPANAAPAVPVAPSGTTRIAAAGPGPAVVAGIATRPATPPEAVAPRATRCTGGATDCSLVDAVTLTVDGRAVEVPPRAVLLLADVSEGEVRRLGGGRYELVLTGGDAAVAYEARLFFDRRRVRRLDIWSDEAGMLEQRTTFDDVSKAFR